MKKKYFIFVILFVFVLIILFVLYEFQILFHKKYSNEYFGILPYRSELDYDQDGIDDQTDILLGAREYVSRQPKYLSKYYSGGYPDDSYGVCTDVVNFSLLSAGYDIMSLLNEDVLLNRDSYSIDVVDKNIDFRRVLNLDTYFKRHAISLTTDIYDYTNWHGGDIVVFRKHIGIVSDMRRKDGIPFVIHHASPYQIYYEEDILKRDQESIIGHYRIS